MTTANDQPKSSEATSAMEIDPIPDVKDTDALFLADLKQNSILLSKAVVQLENRLITRVLRTLSSVRRRLSKERLSLALNTLGKEITLLSQFREKLGVQDESMIVDASSNTITNPIDPEIHVYLGLLVLIYFHDTKDYKEGVAIAETLVAYISNCNRRTLDLLAAKVFFYYARFHELLGSPQPLRPILLGLHRSAVLRGDDESTAVLVNLILRDFLRHKLIEQAEKFVAKSSGIPASASNTQNIRFLYYTGQIKAIHLDYSAAHECLQQAIRKAPSSNSAMGFLQSTHKLAIIVQLLMGELPERSLFRPAPMRRPLEPYRQLVLAVRAGDLVQFTRVVTQAQPIFAKDQTLSLIHRMRHNVIKTGIRQISLAYAAISLKDICLRLGLDAEEDAEYIVAKAIRDGVISSSIDHTRGIVKSVEGASDIYATAEPSQSFHARLMYCLDLHNQSVRAMRYPNVSHRNNAGFTDDQDLRELDLELQMQLEDDMEEF